MNIQILTKDYSGTTNIIATTNDMESALKRISSELNQINFENALTLDEQIRSAEAYFPIVVDENNNEDKNFIYGGMAPGGHHRFYNLSNKTISLEEHDNANVSFFIGSPNKKKTYLRNNKSQPISDFNSEILNDKTVFFVKVN